MTNTTTARPVPYSQVPFPGSEWHGSATSLRSWYFDPYVVDEARPAIRLTIERQGNGYKLQVELATVPPGIEPGDEELLDALDWTRGPALDLEDVLALGGVIADKVDNLVRLSFREALTS